MSDREFQHRRQLVKYLGSAAALTPFGALGGCSGDKEPQSSPPATAADPEPMSQRDAAPADPAPMSQRNVPPAPTGSTGAMPKLQESDPQAQALAYVEDASRVDSAKQPRYEPGQLCSNCALYIAGDDPAWGGCSIFPGKLVSANGWCSVYAPKT